jgi:Protein of unknown function (DUF2384)
VNLENLTSSDYEEVGRRYNRPPNVIGSPTSTESPKDIITHHQTMPEPTNSQFNLLNLLGFPLGEANEISRFSGLHDDYLAGFLTNRTAKGKVLKPTHFPRQFWKTQDQHALGMVKQNEFLRVFMNLSDRWALESGELPILLGYPSESDTFARLMSGHITPNTQDLIDRIAYMLEISVGLEAIYGDNPKIEQRWLKEPHHLLKDKSPLDHMLQGHMENLMTIVDLLRDERGL